MCAQYEIEKSMFMKKMDKLVLNISDFDLPKRVLPHTSVPVLVKQDQLRLKQMNFSLIPWWSKDRKPKFATHNARIETVLEKPTWKHLFEKKHCLIPITSFIEPIYEGEYAGNMVQFNLRECYLIPGLFDSWIDKSSGACIDSFAILTADPGPFIKGAGHDRSPIFLNQTDIVKWLEIPFSGQNTSLKMLKNTIEPIFSIGIDRKLKKGWEKRLEKTSN